MRSDSGQREFISIGLAAALTVAGFGLLLMLSATELWAEQARSDRAGVDYQSGSIVRWLGLAAITLAVVRMSGAGSATTFGLCALVISATALAAVLWVHLFIVGDVDWEYSGPLSRIWEPPTIAASEGLWIAEVSVCGMILGALWSLRLAERQVHLQSADICVSALFVMASVAMPWASQVHGMKLGLDYQAGVVAAVFAAECLIVALLRAGAQINDLWFGRLSFVFAFASAAAVYFVYVVEIGADDRSYGHWLVNYFRMPKVQPAVGMYVATISTAIMLAFSTLAIRPELGRFPVGRLGAAKR